MADFEFDIPIPDEYTQMLLDIIKEAKKHKTLTIHISQVGWNKVGGANYQIGFPGKDKMYSEQGGNPIASFAALGFLEQPADDPKIYFLTAKAYKWAKYQQKSQLGKWFARVPGYIKDTMLFIAFILSVALTILQIIEKLHP
jgi:hypothetical protein